MDISARSLKVKRTVISKLLDAGLYPYTKRYLGSFNSHFSTIGLIGMNEVGLNANWLKKDLTDPETQKFAEECLNHMRSRLSDYQEEYGDLYNLEATPAESTTYRLAKHDKEKYPEIITANMNGTPYYTNSSHLPVGFTDDIFTALDVEDPLQCLYTSGTVFHTFLGERLSGWKAAATLVKKIADNYKLPYYTISPTYSVCPNDGYISGEVWKCPKCGAETEVYSRITGYYRPVKNWNAGKSQEFKDRKTYRVEGLESRPVTDFEAGGDRKPVSVEKSAISGKPDQVLLFTTKTCPNCRMIEEMLDKMGFKYQIIDAEEHTDLVKQYGIMQAPTLVMVHGDQADTFVNASNILKFVNETARA